MIVLHAQITRKATVIVALVVMVFVGISVGQQVVNRGYALDANLQVGSGGYNRAARGSYLYRPRYTVGATRYGVNNRGGVGFYRSHNSMARQRYKSTGYRGSRSYQSRNFPSRRYRY